MPKKQTQKPMRGARMLPKYNKTEIKKINDYYLAKYEEYSTYDSQKLETIVASKTEKGTGLKAIFDILEARKRQEIMKSKKDKEDGKLSEIKEESIKEEGNTLTSPYVEGEETMGSENAISQET